MVKPYDIAIKKLIEIFSNKIPVVGLQGDDTSQGYEQVMTQAGKSSAEDKISFPIISVFRNPDIEITDGAMTKRAHTSVGYSDFDYENYTADSLVAMRTTLTYTVDVFDVTKHSAEEIAMRLFWRLRNNPEVKVEFKVSGYENKSYPAIAEIELEPTITNVKTPALNDTQLYKVRFSFKLVNANILDVISKELPREINWIVTAELDSKGSFNNKI